MQCLAVISYFEHFASQQLAMSQILAIQDDTGIRRTVKLQLSGTMVGRLNKTGCQVEMVAWVPNHSMGSRRSICILLTVFLPEPKSLEEVK